MLQFEIPKNQGSIIKVIGVGGGGSNAVNHMYRMGIKGVDFIVCNTDNQALEYSPVPAKIQLGGILTKGLGAGSIPEVGKNAALESLEELKTYLADGTQMVFITAGLGGGTGTGAAPIIAKIAKELNILTVGIVTIPFVFEGKKRRQQAEEGLEELKNYVDTLLVIGNDKLREIYGNLKMSEAFAHADNVLTNAAKSIAEIITLNLYVNTDFNDVRTVMKDSGVAIMGSAVATGERRALKAVENAINSPLLNDNNIRGARHVLLNIMTGSDEVTMDEFGEITDFIQEQSGYTAELITGYGSDPSLGDSVSVTIIATGFNSNPSATNFEVAKKEEKVVLNLEETANEIIEEVKTKIEPVQLSIIVEEETKTAFEEPFLIIKENENEAIASIIEIDNSQEELSKVYSINETSENQEMNTIVFELKETSDEMTSYIAESSIETNEVKGDSEEELIQKIHNEEQIRKAQERISKLKELTDKIKTSNGLKEMETVPAYIRKQIQLNNVPHSSESQISKFTLTETEDKKIELRPNNSFLHDNVD
jgi:cell division protein FtsZ